MKILVHISRFIVGVLFIISGLIKMNDPVGFSFKLEEYFSPPVLDLDFLTPYALAIAIFLVIFETLLGVMLLVGFRKNFTVWSLLGMIVFFTFLTWYSAYFNKVTDCGCFGDAVKLTPWESFSKDVVLLILILILFFGRNYIKPLFNEKAGIAIMGVSLVLSIWFSVHVISHLPSVDFRPYKVGNNIEEGMSIPEGAPTAVYEYAWRFNVNGEEQVITTTGDYPQVDGDFVDVETKEIQKGYEPPIHDFTIELNGEDHAEEILNLPKVLIIICRDLGEVNAEGLKAIAPIATEAAQKGYRVIGISASGAEEINPVKEKFGLDFEFYFCDLTTLKTIVRSNPGIVVLNEGTITQKLHFNDLKDLSL